MAKHKGITRRQLLGAGAVAAGASLLPGHVFAAIVKDLAAQAQDPVVDAVKGASGREKIAWKVQPFPMTQVRLRPGPFMNMMEINRRYVALLPNDRLLHTFRSTAGLQSSATPL